MSEKFFDRKSWENSIGLSIRIIGYFSAGLIVSLLIYYVLYGIASIFSVESLIFTIASVIGPFFIIFYFIMCITKVLIDEM